MEADVEVLFALHAVRWQQRRQPGVLKEGATRRFHRAAAARMAADATLQLTTIWIGEAPAAACYGFVHGDRAYDYLGGFDTGYSKLNPGKLAIAAAIDEARQRGAMWFDFLGGSEPYKYEWGAVDEPRYRRTIQRRRGWAGSEVL